MRSFLFILLAALLIPGLPAEAQSDAWRIYTRDNSPIPDNTVLSIAIDSSGITWLGTTQGVARIDGDQWTIFTPESSPLPARIVPAVAVDRNGVAWFGTVNGGIARFDGTSWSVYDSANSLFPTNAVYAIAIDSLNNPIATTDSGYAAFDGAGWTLYNDENSGLPGPHARGLAIARDGSRWIGVFDPFQVSGRIAVHAGRGWRYHSLTSRGMPSSYPAAIAIDRNDVVWVGTAGGGLGRVEHDLWEVYNHANSGIPSNGVVAIAFEGSATWLGTGLGLARFDGGDWKVYDTHNSPLKDDYIHAVAVDRRGRKWVGTDRGGLAVLEQGSAAGVEESGTAGTARLLGAHPNPLRDATTIAYELRAPGDVELTVHDMLGRVVATLDRGGRDVGRHDVRLDAASLPAGVYICRLDAGGRSDARMMVVAR